MPPKYESGAQKRKRKRNEIALTQSQLGDIDKYFKRNNVNALNEDEVDDEVEEVMIPACVNEVDDKKEEEVTKPACVNEVDDEVEEVLKPACVNDHAIDLLQGLVSFLEKYREIGFATAMDEATKKASEMGIEAVFREKRLIRRKKQFDESGSDEVKQSAEESFRVEFFVFIIDQALFSLRTRFEQFKQYDCIFGFLFNLKRLRGETTSNLLKSCMNLEKYLEHNGRSDISGDDLFSELISLKEYIPSEVTRAIEMLQYLKPLDACFPNAYIAYKIVLTIPVTVASAERSFSKLKLIKTYLRSTMSQERLNGLAMLSIEKEMVEQLNYSDLINVFASKTARRIVFK